jgi:hypothetical protein
MPACLYPRVSRGADARDFGNGTGSAFDPMRLARGGFGRMRGGGWRHEHVDDRG